MVQKVAFEISDNSIQASSSYVGPSVLNLECRNCYRIRPSAHVTDEQSANDEVFRMFGEMQGQDVAFMRQWVRCFILTHCKFVNKVASKYISEHSLKLQEWAKDLNKGCKADVLALFLLCIAQGSHSSWKTWENGDSFSILEKSWNFVIFAKYPGKMRQTLEI